jgi:uncharacterized RDD family membrane protein YckC
VVDPFQLTFDIAGDAVTLLLPATLWALLFLLAWEQAPFAESIGFGRWAFWLLLPGALLASFALLPIAPVSYDWVAVSLAGALFPLLVGALAFGRAAPPLGRSVARYLGFVTVEAAVLLLLVLPISGPITSALAVGGLSTYAAGILVVFLASVVLTAIALTIFGRGSNAAEPADRSSRIVGFALALTTGVLASTFAASSAIPGVGIVESFPEYLLPPVGAGVVAVVLAPWVFPGREGFALPTAFFSATFGVLLGADLLRQPPLYGTGPAGLYTIGGAGVLDLVYLSGLLAFGAAYATHRALGRRLVAEDGATAAPRGTPFTLLVASYRAGVRGDLAASIESADRASHDAARQAHRLLDLPEAPEDRPWQGLPVPGWVVADQANLDAVARAGTADPREGFRAWLTARWLVNVGRDLGFRRFATVGGRAAAFAVDLAVVVAPAILVWSVVAVLTPGDLLSLLSNVGFNAAIYGFIALAFFFLVLSETLTGTSPGKRALGLAVRDRSMHRPEFPAALVRNVSLLPVLTILGIGGALAVAFVLKPSGLTSLTVAGIALPAGLLATASIVFFLVGGIGLLGALGALSIALTSERQRLGDVWAGTWVVRAASPVRYPIPPVAASAPAPPSPSGPLRTS